MKKKRVPAPIVMTPVITMDVQEYKTVVVFSVPGKSDSDLYYQARQKLVARGIQCNVVDIGGRHGLSVPIGTVRERGADFVESMKVFLCGIPRAAPA